MQPPSGSSESTGESAIDDSHVVANLDPDGTAHLHALGPGDAYSLLSHGSNGSTSEDDYAVDPSNVVEGSRGGALAAKPTLRRGSIAEDPRAAHTAKRPLYARRKSIPVKLETTKVKGRYLLRADDPALEEILQRVTRRESVNSSRTRFSDLVFTRQFTAFDRLNPNSGSSPFHGFFTLFWLCIVFMLVKVAANNYRVSGSIFGTNELLTMMFNRDVVVMGLSDIVMLCATSFCLLLQKAIRADLLTWNKSGWIIQSMWQLFYIIATIQWTIHREWPWQHTVFISLHCIVMLMKQHSYAFYNGHLSEVWKRRAVLQRKLKDLEFLDPPTAGSTDTPGTATAIASSYFEDDHAQHLRRRRRSLAQATDSKGQQDQNDMISVAQAIKSGAPLDNTQLDAFERVLESELEALDKELRGKCTDTENFYPRNLNLSNFVDYIPLPTVVYELEYPRQESINWSYVAEKAAATFGVLGVMIVVSQAFIYPVVMETVEMKDQGTPFIERLKAFPWVLNDLLFPFLIEYILAWYVIWECILNLLAELTRFADRGFYADWWNSVSWDQFARDWNVPVHNFLLRHVYHSSISSFRVSKGSATLITFFLSAIAHELVMWTIFKKLRGYLLCMQMLQLPLVMLSKSKLLRQRKVLGNIIFWIGIFTGPSLLCSLYLVI